MKKKWKIALGVVAVLVVIVIFAPSEPDEQTTEPATIAASATTVAPATAAPTTAAPTTEPPKKESHEITFSSAVTYKNSIGTVWCYLVYEVTNTGTVPLYMSAASCDIEDKDGKLLKSLSLVSCYPEVIDPGEKAYYIDSTTLNELSDIAEVVIQPRVSAKAAKVDNIRLAVTDVEIVDDQYGGLRARGRVENTTDEEQTFIQVVVIPLDENGNALCVIMDYIMDDMAPGDKIGFESSSLTAPDDITTETISSFIVFAYPQQFQF